MLADRYAVGSPGVASAAHEVRWDYGSSNDKREPSKQVQPASRWDYGSTEDKRDVVDPDWDYGKKKSKSFFQPTCHCPDKVDL